MARLELAPEVFGDFERILDHLAGFAGADAGGRIGEIVAGEKGCTVAGSAETWSARAPWEAVHHG